MSLYKKDMVAVLQNLAEKAGMPTTYEDRSITARQKRAKLCSIARKKRQSKADDSAQGPPDRNSDLSRKRKRTDGHKKVCRILWCTCRVYDMHADAVLQLQYYWCTFAYWLTILLINSSYRERSLGGALTTRASYLSALDVIHAVHLKMRIRMKANLPTL